MVRHWAINGRFLAQAGTGVQRYANEVVIALDHILSIEPALAQSLEIEIVAPPDASTRLALRSIPVRKVGHFGGHTWEQTVLPHHTRGGLLSLCNTGPVTHRRQIVCVHDMNTRLCPQSYSPAFRLLYRTLLPAIGRTAAALVTVSEFSAGQIAHFRIRRRESIATIPGGHEHTNRWTLADVPATPDRALSNAIVLIGSPAPHKNIGLVLDLADLLEAEGLRIAVIGRADERVFRGNARASAGNVASLGRLSDAALGATLRGCLCLAFPSLTEGFGLPPLEAMALGCPVVAARCASLPEVCGDAALYAEPDSPDAWLGHFIALRDSPELRNGLSIAGRQQARQFRWEKAARGYLEIMATLDGVRTSFAA